MNIFGEHYNIIELTWFLVIASIPILAILGIEINTRVFRPRAERKRIEESVRFFIENSKNSGDMYYGRRIDSLYSQWPC